MMEAARKIRWKRDLDVEVLTNWSEDTGLFKSHLEKRSAGQEECVFYDDDPHWPDVQMHLEDVSTYYDQSWGRMIPRVSRNDFEVVSSSAQQTV